jgi:hypothetical protein
VDRENVSDPVSVQLFAILRIAKVANVEAGQNLQKTSNQFIDKYNRYKIIKNKNNSTIMI